LEAAVALWAPKGITITADTGYDGKERILLSHVALARLLLLTLLSPELISGTIEGTVIIKRRLTKKKVTAPASSYTRGIGVELKPESRDDILDLERSRVIVYLEGKLPKSVAGAEIVQEGRHFVPDTVAIPAGSTVTFPNRDPIFHNVFSLTKAKSFDLGNYAQGQMRTVTFPKPGIVFVHCHLHPNMTAAILVAPNSFVTIAGKDGKFNFHDVPSGDYIAVAWHRAAGFFRHPVKVSAAGDASVEFFIPLDEDQPKKSIAK
jgi:plastocyanin